jgi:hypothetical protein
VFRQSTIVVLVQNMYSSILARKHLSWRKKSDSRASDVPPPYSKARDKGNTDTENKSEEKGKKKKNRVLNKRAELLQMFDPDFSLFTSFNMIRFAASTLSVDIHFHDIW